MSPGQVGVVEVRDVVHRLRDEVHRHDRGLAALGPGQREPLGQGVAQLLEQLEEVVGPVDLVHLAGLGVADDDPRAEDQRLGLHAVAHHLLGLVLGPVVVVGQLLLLVEHVLLEHALVGAGHGDRAGVVKAPDVVGVRELDHVLGALDVGLLRGLLVGLDVVHRGEVEEVVDLLVEVLDAEAGLGQVAVHRHDPALGRAEALDQGVDLAARPLADQHVDRALALQQLLDEMAADEAGGAGHEVVHRCCSLSLRSGWPRESIPQAAAPPFEATLTRALARGRLCAAGIRGRKVEERVRRKAPDRVAGLRRGPIRPRTAAGLHPGAPPL